MKIVISTICLATLIIPACNNEKKDSTTTTGKDAVVAIDTSASSFDTGSMRSHAQAIITQTKTDTILSGTASFDTTAGGKVKLVLELSIISMANKTVAVHIHEHGDCGDKGEMSHGHWNPTNENHGKWGSGSFHSGDIGNVKLDASGKGSLILETDRWTLGGSSSTDILNKSVIVHGRPDDYKTQPTGDAGSRIGCGVIQ